MPLSEILNTAVYGVLIAFAVIGLYLGFTRGFSRQTVKLVTVLLAFIISLAIFNRIYPYMVLIFEERTLLEVAKMLGLSFNETITSYLEVIEGEDAAYIMSVPLTVVIIPVCFVLMVAFVTLVLNLPYMVVCGALGFTKQANGPIKRILGGALGALQGVFIAALILTPVAGMIDIAKEAVTYAETDHPDFQNTEKISKLYHDNIDTVSENPVLNIVDNAFGSIYDNFTTVDVEGEKVRISTAVDDMVELYVYYGELGGEGKFDYKNPTPEDKVILEKMIDSFGDDRLMTVIVSDFFKALGTSSASGAFVLGIDEPLKSLMTSLLVTFATVDEENVEGDLYTFCDVYYLLATEGIFGCDSKDDMFVEFLKLDENGNTVFKRLCLTIETNPRYTHTAATVSNIGMELLLNDAGVDQDTVEALTDVKNTVNEVLNIDKESFETEEQYKEAVNTEISNTLTNNGIELEPEQMDQLTDYIIQQKEETGKTEFNDSDMADFIAKYYDVYSKGQEGTLPPDLELPE